MIQVRGHIALILPRFARVPFSLQEVGMYRYRGAYDWDDIGGAEINQALHFTESV
jgi:hypothetical protein